MAQTLTLNSDSSIMITTFWGGAENGRSYTIHLFIGELELETTLNEEQFFEMVINYNDDIEVSKFVAKPEAVNMKYRSASTPSLSSTLLDEVKKVAGHVDPDLQVLLDEEEEIAAQRPRQSPWTWTNMSERESPVFKVPDVPPWGKPTNPVDDAVQFARLLCAINVTSSQALRSIIVVQKIAEEMGIDVGQVNAMFDHATEVCGQANDRETRLKTNEGNW